MSEYTQFAKGLSTWYRGGVREFLSEVANDRIEQLDQEFTRLGVLGELSHRSMPVCFLGAAGVGKSTLINALVAGRDVILPAGGVGPLTAEATRVCYARERQFRVTYQPPGKLNRLLFVLERAHEKDPLREGDSSEPGSRAATASKTALAAQDLDEEAWNDSAGDAENSQQADRLSVLSRQAVHLIRGDQYTTLDRGYVLDRLRDCLGAERRWGTIPLPEDATRVAKVKEILERARTEEGRFEFTSKGSESIFRAELELHAAGHLAPLVRSIDVGWDTELLATGVELIDLPGVGVANDEFRRVTAHWIRQARGVVLVVDRAGMTEASAELLRSSGFLSSLLHQSGDPEDLNATLIVAVAKLDATADDARAKEKIMSPGAVRPWIAHFDEACARADLMVREQLAVELQKVGEQGGESTREERAVVVQRVLEGLQVHPVVAPQYRKLLAADDDDLPRIKTVEQSRIPALSKALGQLVAERNERVQARVQLLTKNIGQRVVGLLELTQAKAEHEGTQKREKADRVRRSAETFAEPLRKEIINKQGEFREFLRSTIPLQIQARVDAAAEAARADIGKHLRKYQKYHWGTLRAAVRRGGAYQGARNVDLPADLALLFEEPVAIAWSKHVLKELRTRTRAMGREYVSILGDMVDWGRRQGDDLDPKVLEAMHRELQAQMEGMDSLGREAIDELRNKVKHNLYERVEGQIRLRCEAFVRDGGDRGGGVKNRILELLSQLGDIVVDAARPVAVDVLKSEYAPVEAEIRRAFEKYSNPVEAALKAIIGDDAIGVQKKTAERQLELAARARKFLENRPVPASLSAEAAQ